LRQLLEPGEEVPELYSDPVYQRSGYWALSTSAIFSKHFLVYGWGEVRKYHSFFEVLLTSVVVQVVPDGFGVAYMTGFDSVFSIAHGKSCDSHDVFADYLQFSITSRREMPNVEFMKEIAKAAEDLYILHVDNQTMKALL